MIESPELKLRRTVTSRNPLVRWFTRSIMDKAVKYANLDFDDVILDFGCGGNWLKWNYPYNITGYDIEPTYTDISDYRKLKPNKIFALSVFEHMTPKEIEETIKSFKKMSSFELIVHLPTDNRMTKIVRILSGKTPKTVGHIIEHGKIISILDRELIFIRGCTLLHIAIIRHYSFKIKKESERNER